MEIVGHTSTDFGGRRGNPATKTETNDIVTSYFFLVQVWTRKERRSGKQLRLRLMSYSISDVRSTGRSPRAPGSFSSGFEPKNSAQGRLGRAVEANAVFKRGKAE